MRSYKERENKKWEIKRQQQKLNRANFVVEIHIKEITKYTLRTSLSGKLPRSNSGITWISQEKLFLAQGNRGRLWFDLNCKEDKLHKTKKNFDMLIN